MKKKIDGLREWALIKVRLASKKCSDECIVETVSVEDKEKEIKQTKREREEDILMFFGNNHPKRKKSIF